MFRLFLYYANSSSSGAEKKKNIKIDEHVDGVRKRAVFFANFQTVACPTSVCSWGASKSARLVCARKSGRLRSTVVCRFMIKKNCQRASFRQSFSFSFITHYAFITRCCRPVLHKTTTIRAVCNEPWFLVNSFCVTFAVPATRRRSRYVESIVPAMCILLIYR